LLLELERVAIGYGGEPVVRDVGFGLERGRIGCLLGPSGCGKTTVLRGIAGFEPLTEGRIALDGVELSVPGRTVPPERRGIGMVFQDFALFGHLTVEANVGFGIRGWGTAERRARVAELLELVGLAHHARDFPHELSGGEQQRVALARALAPRPRLLLLDEPFSSLDVALRSGLAREVRQILRHEGMTAILVTHDQLEAFAIADEIGVLEAGRLVQWGRAYDLYHRPASRFVARFIGQGTLIRGRVLDAGAVETALGAIESREPLPCAAGAAVEVLMRPDDVVCVAAAESVLHGVVEEQDFRGAAYLYTIRLDNGERVLSLARSHERFSVGSTVGLALDSRHLIVFPE